MSGFAETPTHKEASLRSPWRDHIEALSRFNAWEIQRHRIDQKTYAERLAWLSEAWELASRYGRPSEPEQHDRERLERWVRLREALGRVQLAG